MGVSARGNLDRDAIVIVGVVAGVALAIHYASPATSAGWQWRDRDRRDELLHSKANLEADGEPLKSTDE
jgi:hypothetical protein